MSLEQTDLLLILDYIDGRLCVEEMVGAELRFANEPELGAACESFEAMDALQRATARNESAPLRPVARFEFLRGGMGMASAAAAVILAVCAGLYVTRERSGPEATRVAILRSEANILGFNGELQLDPEWLTVDPGQLRGNGDGNAGASAGEYYEHSAPLQERRLENTRFGEQASEPMMYFNVVLGPTEPRSAIVLLLESDGTVVDAEGRPFKIAFPAEETWNGGSGRLEGGGLTILPRRNLTWDPREGGRVVYDPGFLVPLDSESVLALVGLRPEALDGALRDALVAKLQDLSGAQLDAGATAAALRTWMEGAGFELREFLVEEQK